MKIKKNDTVKVIAGKDKGATGTVARVLPDEDRVVVSGVNTRTKHQRGSQSNPGQKVEIERPVHISNVALVDPDSGEATRVGFSTNKNGEKVRVSKKSGKEV